MTKVIAVLSGKGGVGKTTLVANLGVALADMGKNVLLIDGNLSGANLGLHLDILPFYPFSLNNVLKGDIPVEKGIYRHYSGVEVMPASLLDHYIEPERLKHVVNSLLGKKDFIIIDGAAGMDREVRTAIAICDTTLIVTNPELTALTDAVRLKKMVYESGKDIMGVVINRVAGEKFELNKEYIEDFLGVPVLAIIPEHKKIKEAIAAKTPVFIHAPYSRPSYEIKKLSYLLAEEEMPSFTLWERFKAFLGIK
ncbi:MAG TPA: septum site-determining protein MinD [Candidatus Aenigmarchaeota archaeon]|nr:MAG: septum site-determining protein MinD [Candidatus Aenigmarchaeota archaeon]HDD45906.1 septum site-determining protein MinD [Candidatus Aenigmarchaeota archaeon]